MSDKLFEIMVLTLTLERRRPWTHKGAGAMRGHERTYMKKNGILGWEARRLRPRKTRRDEAAAAATIILAVHLLTSLVHYY